MAQYRLNKIILKGFKSFNRKTEIKLQQGIIAIVGPNGCGKSNISDAVSWALGEQSLRTLRSNRLEELIFNGGADQPPLSMTEVSLFLTPTGNPSPQGLEPMQITRRLYRSGESIYQMNGQNCRLLDILNKFLGTGLWTKAYSIIEQGRIATIVNSKPEEIRLMLEEAAGISKYKLKRNKAQNRLKAAESNLIRLHDIIEEVKRQRNSLKRQAARARHYKNLRERLRQLEQKVFAVKCRSLLNQKSTVSAQLTKFKEETDNLKTLLSQEEKLSAALRTKLERIEEQIQELHDRHYQSRLKKDRIENEISYSLQRTEDYASNLEENKAFIEVSGKQMNAKRTEYKNIEEQLNLENMEFDKINKEVIHKEESIVRLEDERLRIRTDLEKINTAFLAKNKQTAAKKKQLDELVEEEMRIAHQERIWKKEQGKLKDEAKNLEEEISRKEEQYYPQEQLLKKLEAEIDNLYQRIEKERNAIQQLQNLYQRGKDELRHLGHRLRFLNQLVAAHFPHQKTLQALKRENFFQKNKRIENILTNYLEVDKRYEVAIESLLHDLLHAIVVDSYETAHEAINYLRSQKLGYSTFIIKNMPFAEEKTHAEELKQLLKEKGVLGKLSDFIKVSPALESTIKHFLANTLLIENIEDGLRLMKNFARYIFITPEGEKVYPNGIVSGGWKKKTPGLLSLEGQKQEVRNQIKEKHNHFKNFSKKLEAAIASEQKLIAEHKEKNKELQLIKKENTAKEQDLIKKKTQLHSIRERMNHIEEEMKQLQHDNVKITDKKGEAEKALSIAVQEMETIEVHITTLQNKLKESEGACATAKEEMAESKAKLNLLQERRNSLDRELHRLKVDIESIKEQQELKKSQIEELEHKRANKFAKAESLKEELKECTEENKNLEAEIRKKQHSSADQKEENKEAEERIKNLRARFEAEQEKRNELKLSLTEIETSLNHLRQDCHNTLQKNIEQILEEEREEEDIDAQTYELEKENISSKLSRMGAVNLMAFEEFNRLDERYQFLTQQQQDITDSIDSLQRTIKRINQISRRKFRQAFEIINQNFQNTFNYFFNGGGAELELTDGHDILESGITIKAKPPGKRLQNINLLSGGEKALTAIALLFAIFQFKPSPFCLLDEIDATLDEMNINKLVKMLVQLKQKTQFIVITHNQMTMEAADLIYGVTMEKPGISKVVSVQFEEQQKQSSQS
jgi:chromosome segregation protein